MHLDGVDPQSGCVIGPQRHRTRLRRRKILRNEGGQEFFLGVKIVYCFIITYCSGLSRFDELLKGLGAVSEFPPSPLSCQKGPSPQDITGFERDARFAPYRLKSHLG